jgi:hypothetical protein
VSSVDRAGEDERALRADVDDARQRVEAGNEGQGVIVHALRELGHWLGHAERAREAAGVLSEAREIAKGEVRASRANPHKQLALLMETDLALAEAQVSDRSACLRTLREATATLAKMRPDADEQRRVETTIARLRAMAERDEPSAPVTKTYERFRHERFGEGTLLAREASGLRIRFDDGIERLLKADRVSPIGGR